MNINISIKEIIRKSWQITRKNIGFFVLVILIYLCLVTCATLIIRKLILTSRTWEYIGQAAFIILESWLSIGIITISLKKARNQDTEISDLFKGFPYLASYIGAYILYFLLVTTGVLLLIVPGIIWGLKYMFYPYLIIDKKMKAIEALRESSRITYGNKWFLLKFEIVLFLIALAGVLALLIGLFWAIPVLCISYAQVYLKITEKAK